MCLLEVEVDDSTDVEVSTDWQRADHFHQLCRWFGIGLTGFIREIELAVGVERVLQLFLQLVGRANPVHDVLGCHLAGLVVDGLHPFSFPFFGTAIIDKFIIPQEREHTFGQDFIHENDNHRLSELRGNLGALIIETAVTLCQRVLIESVLLIHPLFCHLKYFSVHNM